MATLLGRSPKDSYPELLKLNHVGGLSTSLVSVEDGTGTATPLQLSTTQIALNGALWPTSLGTSGQFLQMGANGTMSWSTVSTSGLNYVGTWNAATNTPALASSVGTTGAMYKVSTASTTFTQTLKNAQSGNNIQYFMNAVTGVKVGQAFYFGATFLGYVASINGTTVVSDRTVNAVTSGALTFYTATLDGVSSFYVGDYVFFNGTTWSTIPAINSATVTTALGYTPVNPTALTAYAPLAAPAFTGTPTAPTATAGTNTTQLATTAFVASAVTANGSAPNTTLTAVPLSSTYTLPVTNNIFYSFTVTTSNNVVMPTASTLATGWTTTLYVNPVTSTTTAGVLPTGGSDFFILNGNGISGFTMQIGYAYKLTALPALNRFLVDVAEALSVKDVTTALGYTPANIASPTFTGVPAAPTATAGTNTTQLATTAFVTTAVSAVGGSTPTFTTVTASDYETASLSIVDGGGDPSFASVTALSHFDGLATNATSYNDVINNTMTVTGGPTFATSPVKFGSGSALFGGAGAIYGAAALTDVQASDFTIEAWTYQTTTDTSTERAIVCNGWTIQLYLKGTAVHAYASNTNGTTGGVYTVTLNTPSGSVLAPLNAWNHIAFTRQGGVFSTWVNGQLAQTVTVTSFTIPTSSWNTCIGACTVNNSSYSANWIGNIDEVRITKGIARYTSAFTVPSAAFPNILNSGSRVGFRSTGYLQFGSTTGTNNAGFSSVGQVDSTGLNGMAIGATTPAAITAAGRLQADAYSYTVSALGSVSGTQTLNLSAASEFTMTITGNTTIAFTNTLAVNKGEVVYIRLSNAGAFTITWPTGALFVGGLAPTYTTSGVDMIGVKYDPASSVYMIFVVGLNMAVRTN